MKKLKLPAWNGSKLRDARKKKGLTQSDVSAEFNKLGKTRGLQTHDTTVSAWEHGREPHSYAHLRILAAIVGVKVDTLFDC